MSPVAIIIHRFYDIRHLWDLSYAVNRKQMGSKFQWQKQSQSKRERKKKKAKHEHENSDNKQKTKRIYIATTNILKSFKLFLHIHKSNICLTIKEQVKTIIAKAKLDKTRNLFHFLLFSILVLLLHMHTFCPSFSLALPAYQLCWRMAVSTTWKFQMAIKSHTVKTAITNNKTTATE